MKNGNCFQFMNGYKSAISEAKNALIRFHWAIATKNCRTQLKVKITVQNSSTNMKNSKLMSAHISVASILLL